MKTIFIVDDEAPNIYLAKKALDGTYETYGLSSAVKMFKLLERIMPDLVLLDIIMPDMDGFQALEAMKSDKRYKDIPVVFLTTKNDEGSELRGFELGALDFIIKPFSPPVLKRRIKTHIEVDKLIKESQQELRDIHNATINVIANLVESRDHITGEHVGRTQVYLEILVNELIRTGVYADEMEDWDIELLLPSAQLHDVGKLKVSDMILKKKATLTDEEFALIKTHSIEGEKIISEIIAQTESTKFLNHARKFAVYHHEKWDGTGYPQGLSQKEIPLEGRIMAVADVYDALVSERPYKPPFTHEQAVEIIKKDSGKNFDPEIVKVFLNVEEEIRAKLENDDLAAPC